MKKTPKVGGSYVRDAAGNISTKAQSQGKKSVKQSNYVAQKSADDKKPVATEAKESK